MLKIFRILLTLIGAVIAIQCLMLILKGKLNFGSLVPFVIAVVFIAHGLYWSRVRYFFSRTRWLNFLWYGLWTVFSVWLVSFLVFVVVLNQQINQSQQAVINHTLPDIEAVIVLGSGTVAGKPSPTLAKRLDTAVPIVSHFIIDRESQPNSTVQAGFEHPIIITSGGVGFGRSRSEADIMATYLHEVHGIPKASVQQEGESTSTEENLANSQAILQANGISLDAPIAIVTSDFHTIRAKAIARRQGYANPIMIASPTPISIRYNAWFREYFAFVSGWLLNEY